MNKLPKIKEFAKEELQEQLKNKKIDVDFLINYTINRDKVYNKLINKVNELTDKNKTLSSNFKSQSEVNQVLSNRLYDALVYMESYIAVEEFNEAVKTEFKIVSKLLNGGEND